MICPDCETLNGPSDRLCHICGRDLGEFRASAPKLEAAEGTDDDRPANVLQPHQRRAALGLAPQASEAPPPAPINDATALHLTPKPPIPPEQATRCPSCGASNSREASHCRLCSLPMPGDAEELEARRNGPAWESRTGILDLRSLWATSATVLVSPRVSFERMRRNGGLDAPLTFILALWLVLFPLLIPVSWISANAVLATITSQQSGQGGRAQQQVAEVFDMLRDAWEGNTSADELERRLEELERQRQNPSQPGPPPPPSPAVARPRPPLQIPLAVFALGFPVMFLMSLVSLFLFAGILHLALKLVGAAKSPLETTFRVCAYASGPVLALSLVPVIGGSIAPLVHIVLIAIGLSRAHDTRVGNVIGGWIFMAVLLGLATCGAGGACVAGLAKLG